MTSGRIDQRPDWNRSMCTSTRPGTIRFPGSVNYRGPFGNDDLTARPHRPDALSREEHDGIAERLAPGAVDNGRAHQGGYAGLGTVRRTRGDRHEQQNRLHQGSHGRPQAGGVDHRSALTSAAAIPEPAPIRPRASSRPWKAEALTPLIAHDRHRCLHRPARSHKLFLCRIRPGANAARLWVPVARVVNRLEGTARSMQPCGQLGVLVLYDLVGLFHAPAIKRSTARARDSVTITDASPHPDPRTAQRKCASPGPSARSGNRSQSERPQKNMTISYLGSSSCTVAPS